MTGTSVAPVELNPQIPRAATGSADGGIGASAAVGAAALLVATFSALRRRQQSAGRGRSRSAVVLRADPSKEYDPALYKANAESKDDYVNPWEQRIDPVDGEPVRKGKAASGFMFGEYKGPVYNKVPVVEGLNFPLDPTLYKEPLLPPPPGAMWGDGRSHDGLFYMEIENEDGEMEKTQYWQAVGSRKHAAAVVRMFKGPGQFIINGTEAIEYLRFKRHWWLKAMEPLAAFSQKNNFDIVAKVFGGGYSGQAGAIRLAVARCMQDYDFNWRPLLKKAKYLTRDRRRKESKVVGQHSARKKKPYHKR